MDKFEKLRKFFGLNVGGRFAVRSLLLSPPIHAPLSWSEVVLHCLDFDLCFELGASALSFSDMAKTPSAMLERSSSQQSY